MSKVSPRKGLSVADAETHLRQRGANVAVHPSRLVGEGGEVREGQVVALKGSSSGPLLDRQVQRLRDHFGYRVLYWPDYFAARSTETSETVATVLKSIRTVLVSSESIE